MNLENKVHVKYIRHIQFTNLLAFPTKPSQQKRTLTGHIGDILKVFSKIWYKWWRKYRRYSISVQPFSGCIWKVCLKKVFITNIYLRRTFLQIKSSQLFVLALFKPCRTLITFGWKSKKSNVEIPWTSVFMIPKQIPFTIHILHNFVRHSHINLNLFLIHWQKEQLHTWESPVT